MPLDDVFTFLTNRFEFFLRGQWSQRVARIRKRSGRLGSRWITLDDRGVFRVIVRLIGQPIEDAVVGCPGLPGRTGRGFFTGNLESHWTDSKGVVRRQLDFTMNGNIIDQRAVAAAQVLQSDLVSLADQATVLAAHFVRGEPNLASRVASDQRLPFGDGQSLPLMFARKNDEHGHRDNRLQPMRLSIQGGNPSRNSFATAASDHTFNRTAGRRAVRRSQDMLACGRDARHSL